MMNQLDKSKFEVLLSCMYQTNFDIAYKSKVDSDLLIINQCDKDDYHEIEVNGYVWRMISTTERGLSRSRNMALRNARGEICQLCDDDEVLIGGYKKNILDAYNALPSASMIAFNVKRINTVLKKKYYQISETKETKRSFASPMLTFRLKDILENGIIFNELFGSGTAWGPGEDSLFIRDVRSAGLMICECPSVIAIQDYSNESKWFHGYNERYFYNQGAFSEYCKTPKLKRELYNLYSSFYKLRKEKYLGPIQKIKWRHKGEKGWKNGVTYSQYMANGCKYKP